jgi:glycosyltransferase involved in cell wall biosynthesis
VANFEHRSKTFRSFGFQLRPIMPGFDVAIVPTTAYSANISVRRILFERTYARRVRDLMRDQARPDVIVLCEPALFTSGPIVALARELGVPLLLDICDLWPELFRIAIPRILSPWSRLLLAPLYRRRANLVRRSAGYIAVSKDYLSLMQSIAPRPISGVAYVGVDVPVVRRGIVADVPLPARMSARRKVKDDVWLIYAGSLGPNYDIATILGAAELLLREDPNITIFLAGDGPLRGAIESRIATRALRNCVFLGSVSPESLTRLYGLCDIALCAYVEYSTVSMPIKAFDYLAAGLPIINSLDRDLGEFV